MERLRPSAGPETAWYWNRLHKKRLAQRNAGVIILGLDFVLLLTEILLAPGHDLRNVLLLLLISLLPFFQGLGLLLANWGEVQPAEVERLRSYERALLFRQAQGIDLPWQYRRWTLLFELLLGLLILLATAQIIWSVLDASPIGNPLPMLVWSPVGLFFLLGLMLVVDSLSIKPRRARQLMKRSSAELSYRLSLGELSTDCSMTLERKT